MEVISDVNELLTTKLCSPVIIFGVVATVSLISVYLCHRSLSRYNTLKMENLKNICMIQEFKYLILLGIIMFGLCQYNKTELAWVFLIFPIIYVIIQNSLLYIHVSSAVQNAPQEQILQASSYGLGMAPPLLETKGPDKPEITNPEKNIPVLSTGGGFEYAKPSYTSNLMTGSSGFGGSGGSSGLGGLGGLGGNSNSWDSAF